MQRKRLAMHDYDFEAIYDAGINFEFVYQGKTYYLQTDKSPTDVYIYALPSYHTVAVYHSKEEMYNAVLFVRPIAQVVADSYILSLD